MLMINDHQVLKVFKPKEQHLYLTEDLSLCFYKIQRWMTHYYLQLNGSKTQIILFGPHDVLYDIPLGGAFLSQGITHCEESWCSNGLFLKAGVQSFQI